MPASTLDFKKRKRPKRGDGWIFLLLLGLSTIFWFVAKLNDDQLEKELRFEVEIAITSPDRILTNSSSEYVTVVAKGSGYQLVNYHFFKKKHLVIAENLSDVENNLSETQVQLAPLFQSQFPNLTLTSITPATLNFITQKRFGKKVPVVANTTITLAPGFDYLQPPAVYPDSIWVYGPKEVILEIDSIFTQPFESLATKNPIFTSLPLIKERNESLFFEQDHVDFEIIIKEFTEKRFTLPIATENLNKQVMGKIIPEEVTLVCRVSTENYGLVSPSQFVIEPDLPSQGKPSDFLKLKVTKSSSFATDWYLIPEQVDFIRTP
ncbi:MAG: hypothetical protein LAT76_05550 [Schleiferiaceae bacterium]|nr:hypothetical protein [Schleiferiaceae bacterium]